MLKARRAQIFSEYVMLISIVVLAVVTMYMYVKRSSQSLIKLAADQIGVQQNADQDFNSLDGYLLAVNTYKNSLSTTDTVYEPGSTSRVYSDKSSTLTNTTTNQGFQEDE